mgnify:CR=1 FL=1
MARIDRRPVFGVPFGSLNDTITGKSKDFYSEGFSVDFEKMKRGFEAGYRRFVLIQPAGGNSQTDDGTSTYYPSAVWEGLDWLTQNVSEEDNPNQIDYKQDLIDQARDFKLYVEERTNEVVELSFYVGFRAGRKLDRPLDMANAINMQIDTNEPFSVTIDGLDAGTRTPEEFIDENWGPLLDLSMPDLSGYRRIYFDNSSTPDTDNYQSDINDPFPGSRYNFRQIQAYLKGRYNASPVMEAIPTDKEQTTKTLRRLDAKHVNGLPSMALFKFWLNNDNGSWEFSENEEKYIGLRNNSDLPNVWDHNNLEEIPELFTLVNFRRRVYVPPGLPFQVRLLLDPEVDYVRWQSDQYANARLDPHPNPPLIQGVPRVAEENLRYIPSGDFNDGPFLGKFDGWGSTEEDFDTNFRPFQPTSRYTRKQGTVGGYTNTFIDQGYIPFVYAQSAVTQDGENQDIGVAINVIRYLQGNLISYDTGSKEEVENPLLNANETNIARRIDTDDDSSDNGAVPNNLRNRIYRDNVEIGQVPYRGGKFNKNGVYAFL